MKKIIHIIDSITDWVGKLASWLILFLIFTLVYEVISRHLFNKPTFWSYDLSYMLGGAAAFLGIAWVQRNKGHVRVDIFYERLSERNWALVDLTLTILLLLPLMTVAFLNSADAAMISWIRGETASGAWRPPIYPLKTVIPLAILLVIMQGISEIFKNILTLLGRGEEL